MKKNILLLVAMIAFGFSTAFAVPATFNFQGRLLQQSGTPAEGDVTIVVRIYDVASGGNPIHTETLSNVSVDNGFYNIRVGAKDSNPMSNVTGKSTLYYELEFDGATTARVAFDAVPYALGAQNAINAEYAAKADSANYAKPIGAAGGVLAGNYPNPGFNQTEFTNAVNNVFKNGSIRAVPTGNADGDITGEYPSNLLIKKNAVKTDHIAEGVITPSKNVVPTDKDNNQLIWWNGTAKRWDYATLSKVLVGGGTALATDKVPYWNGTDLANSDIYRHYNSANPAVYDGIGVGSNLFVDGDATFGNKVVVKDSLIANHTEVKNLKADDINVNNINANDVTAKNVSIENITITGDVLAVKNVNATGYVYAGGEVKAGNKLTVSAGGANITGGIDNNAGGITNAGAISGATTINADAITTTGNLNVGGTSIFAGASTFNTAAGYNAVDATGLPTTGTVDNKTLATKGYTDYAINANITGTDKYLPVISGTTTKTLVNSPLTVDALPTATQLTVAAGTDLVAPAINTTAGKSTTIGNATGDVVVNSNTAIVNAVGDINVTTSTGNALIKSNTGTVTLQAGTSTGKVIVSNTEVEVTPNLKVANINTLAGDGNLTVGKVSEGQTIIVHGSDITIGDDNVAGQATQEVAIDGQNINIGVGGNNLANKIAIGNDATAEFKIDANKIDLGSITGGTNSKTESVTLHTDIAKAGLEYDVNSVNVAVPVAPANPLLPYMPNMATNYTLATKGYVNSQVGINNTAAHRVPYRQLHPTDGTLNSWESSIFINPYGTPAPGVAGNPYPIPTEVTATGNFYVGPLGANPTLSAVDANGKVVLANATFGTDTTGYTFVGNGTTAANFDVKNGNITANGTNFVVQGSNGDVTSEGVYYVANAGARKASLGETGLAVTAAANSGLVVTSDIATPTAANTIAAIGTQDGTTGFIAAGTANTPMFTVNMNNAADNGLARYNQATAGTFPMAPWMPVDVVGSNENTALITYGFVAEKLMNNVTATYIPFMSANNGGTYYDSPIHLNVDPNAAAQTGTNITIDAGTTVNLTGVGQVGIDGNGVKVSTIGAPVIYLGTDVTTPATGLLVGDVAGQASILGNINGTNTFAVSNNLADLQGGTPAATTTGILGDEAGNFTVFGTANTVTFVGQTLNENYTGDVTTIVGGDVAETITGDLTTTATIVDIDGSTSATIGSGLNAQAVFTAATTSAVITGDGVNNILDLGTIPSVARLQGDANTWLNLNGTVGFESAKLQSTNNKFVELVGTTTTIQNDNANNTLVLNSTNGSAVLKANASSFLNVNGTADNTVLQNKIPENALTFNAVTAGSETAKLSANVNVNLELEATQMVVTTPNTATDGTGIVYAAGSVNNATTHPRYMPQLATTNTLTTKGYLDYTTFGSVSDLTTPAWNNTNNRYENSPLTVSATVAGAVNAGNVNAGGQLNATGNLTVGTAGTGAATNANSVFQVNATNGNVTVQDAAVIGNETGDATITLNTGATNVAIHAATTHIDGILNIDGNFGVGNHPTHDKFTVNATNGDVHTVGDMTVDSDFSAYNNNFKVGDQGTTTKLSAKNFFAGINAGIGGIAIAATGGANPTFFVNENGTLALGTDVSAPATTTITADGATGALTAVTGTFTNTVATTKSIDVAGGIVDLDNAVQVLMPAGISVETAGPHPGLHIAATRFLDMSAPNTSILFGPNAGAATSIEGYSSYQLGSVTNFLNGSTVNFGGNVNFAGTSIVSWGANQTFTGNVSVGGTFDVAGNSVFTASVTVPTPTAAVHAANKGYVDALIPAAAVASGVIPMGNAGGTGLMVSGMTSDGTNVSMAAAPVAANHLTNKTYVDTQIGNTMATMSAGVASLAVVVAGGGAETPAFSNKAVYVVTSATSITVTGTVAGQSIIVVNTTGGVVTSVDGNPLADSASAQYVWTGTAWQILI